MKRPPLQDITLFVSNARALFAARAAIRPGETFRVTRGRTHWYDGTTDLGFRVTIFNETGEIERFL